jgi:hypothetical protein
MFKINESLWSDPNYSIISRQGDDGRGTCPKGPGKGPLGRVPFLSAFNDFQAASGP